MLRLKIQTDCIQCFDTVGWVTDIVSSLKKLSVGMLVVVIWLELCTSENVGCHDYHLLLSLAAAKSRLVWYYYTLTWLSWKSAVKTGFLVAFL